MLPKAWRIDVVAAGDIDRDGDVDVLAALPADNTIVFYENNGIQYFTQISKTFQKQVRQINIESI